MTMVRNDNTRIGSRNFLNARMLGSLTELLQLCDHHGPIFVYRIAQPRYANGVLKCRQRLLERNARRCNDSHCRAVRDVASDYVTEAP